LILLTAKNGKSSSRHSPSGPPPQTAAPPNHLLLREGREWEGKRREKRGKGGGEGGPYF